MDPAPQHFCERVRKAASARAISLAAHLDTRMTMIAWLFYVLSAVNAINALGDLLYLATIAGPGALRFAWFRLFKTSGTAAACYFIGRWIQRRAAAPPSGAARRRMIPMAVLFPLLFLVVVVPMGVFVASGAGTHESPLLLYPFASPWWLLDREAIGEAEIRVLLAGCGVNAVLLAVAGVFADRRRRARNSAPGIQS